MERFPARSAKDVLTLRLPRNCENGLWDRMVAEMGHDPAVGSGLAEPTWLGQPTSSGVVVDMFEYRAARLRDSTPEPAA